MAKKCMLTTIDNPFDPFEQFYNLGMWNEVRVRNAVKKNWITEEEFKEITDKDYA